MLRAAHRDTAGGASRIGATPPLRFLLRHTAAPDAIPRGFPAFVLGLQAVLREPAAGRR
jgi:hypothetical protein